MVAGLVPGQFLARDRAEIAIFLAFRPWLLLVLVAALAAWPSRLRWSNYGAALLLASGGEALLVALAGGAHILADAARALSAGLVLAALLDFAFVVARRAEPRFARTLGLLLGVGLLLVPGPRIGFERVALAPEPPPAAGPRPAVMLLTGLPLLWVEGAPLGPHALRPNAAARRLSAEFALKPIDAATTEALAAASVLLAAQPRPLSAVEIETIDAWVRMGGRALLLADPDLRWPSDLPAGDPRRPPRWATLAPLLAGWGITIARTDRRIATLDAVTAGGHRRIIIDSPGMLRVDPACALHAAARIAECRIGRGRVVILADADVLDDRLWVASGDGGDSRLRRGGDNALLIAEWLDRLAGVTRDRSAESVVWRRGSVPSWVLMGALLPALIILLLSAYTIRRNGRFGRNRSNTFIHRNKTRRTTEMRDPAGRVPPT